MDRGDGYSNTDGFCMCVKLLWEIKSLGFLIRNALFVCLQKKPKHVGYVFFPQLHMNEKQKSRQHLTILQLKQVYSHAAA